MGSSRNNDDRIICAVIGLSSISLAIYGAGKLLKGRKKQDEETTATLTEERDMYKPISAPSYGPRCPVCKNLWKKCDCTEM